jgi:hypothetical protein
MTLEKHAAEETLEEYSRAALPDAEAEILEEHLLVCPECQDRLAEIDAFMRVARQAAMKLQMEEQEALEVRWRELWRWVMRPAVLATACTLAVLVVGLAVGWRAGERREPAFSVYLQAVRGGETLLRASAPGGRPLHFRLDPGGLPALDSYRLEIADVRGTVVLETVARPNAGELTAEVTRHLPAASYWVRVYEPSPPRTLLREFGLTIR